jgi:hypothetical protein
MKTTQDCPHCGRASGWLERHIDTCRRDAALAARAAAHADEAHVYRNGVTELDMARLILALERGTLIHPTASMTQWAAPAGSPLRAPHRPLNATVNEAIRVGLCRVAVEHPRPSVAVTRLAAAPVHARNPRRPTIPRCLDAVLYARTDAYFRLLDDLTLVDCQGCIDRING